MTSHKRKAPDSGSRAAQCIDDIAANTLSASHIVNEIPKRLYLNRPDFQVSPVRTWLTAHVLSDIVDIIMMFLIDGIPTDRIALDAFLKTLQGGFAATEFVQRLVNIGQIPSAHYASKRLNVTAISTPNVRPSNDACVLLYDMTGCNSMFLTNSVMVMRRFEEINALTYCCLGKSAVAHLDISTAHIVNYDGPVSAFLESLKYDERGPDRGLFMPNKRRYLEALLAHVPEHREISRFVSKIPRFITGACSLVDLDTLKRIVSMIETHYRPRDPEARYNEAKTPQDEVPTQAQLNADREQRRLIEVFTNEVISAIANVCDHLVVPGMAEKITVLESLVSPAFRASLDEHVIPRTLKQIRSLPETAIARLSFGHIGSMDVWRGIIWKQLFEYWMTTGQATPSEIIEEFADYGFPETKIRNILLLNGVTIEMFLKCELSGEVLDILLEAGLTQERLDAFRVSPDAEDMRDVTIASLAHCGVYTLKFLCERERLGFYRMLSGFDHVDRMPFVMHEGFHVLEWMRHTKIERIVEYIESHPCGRDASERAVRYAKAAEISVDWKCQSLSCFTRTDSIPHSPLTDFLKAIPEAVWWKDGLLPVTEIPVAEPCGECHFFDCMIEGTPDEWLGSWRRLLLELLPEHKGFMRENGVWTRTPF